MYHISEPIIRRFFPKRVLLCSLSSSFHWFSQLCKETLQHFARFWRLFRSVMWSILAPFLSPFSFFSFFLDFFLTKIVVKFLIKQLFYSGLLDIKCWLSIISYPARPRRIIANYIYIYIRRKCFAFSSLRKHVTKHTSTWEHSGNRPEVLLILKLPPRTTVLYFTHVTSERLKFYKFSCHRFYKNPRRWPSWPSFWMISSALNCAKPHNINIFL